MRGPGDAVGELLDVGERDPPGLGFGEELDGGDLVAVLLEVGAPGLDERAGAAGVDDAVGVDEGVGVDLVDDPVVGGAQLEDPGAQLGAAGDGLDRAWSRSCRTAYAGSAAPSVALAWRSGSTASTRPRTMSRTGIPATVSSSARSVSVSWSSSLASREASVAVSSSVRDRVAALSRSFFRETPLSRFRGGSTNSCSVTPTASTRTNRVFSVASGVTDWKSAGAMVRAPRPFICSKYCAERTSRMKNTHSSGLTSVPVAIMSTVTAILKVGEVRNAWSWLLGSRAV